MLKVYYLSVEPLNETEHVAGETLIHHGILQCTDQSDVRKLIMDTTPEEHDALSALCLLSRDPTTDELADYHASAVITPPDPDTIRAKEILATHPGTIEPPQLSELARIYARRLGYTT